MNHAQRIHKPDNRTAINAEIGTSTGVLDQIHQSGKNIVIYQRDTSILNDTIQRVVQQNIEFRSTGTTDAIERELKALFHSGKNQLIIQDILELLRLFKEITKANSFRLFLATINTNMCRKFHTDVNSLRMLCTYTGPGTLWVAEEGDHGNTTQNNQSSQDELPCQSMINQVDTGNVVILKGALYPDGNPVLHRSPTIETTGQKRLLLRIDINESPWI